MNQRIARTAVQPSQTLRLRLSDKRNAIAEVAGQGRRDPEGETAARRVQQVARGYRQTKSGRGGSDVTNVPLDAQFPHGLFVAMSDN